MKKSKERSIPLYSKEDVQNMYQELLEKWRAHKIDQQFTASEFISEQDDHLAASIVSECLQVMDEYATVTRMKACFNLTCCILRLFMVRGSKKNMEKMADDFHKGLLKEIDEWYE